MVPILEYFFLHTKELVSIGFANVYFCTFFYIANCEILWNKFIFNNINCFLQWNLWSTGVNPRNRASSLPSVWSFCWPFHRSQSFRWLRTRHCCLYSLPFRSASTKTFCKPYKRLPKDTPSSRPTNRSTDEIKLKT